MEMLERHPEESVNWSAMQAHGNQHQTAGCRITNPVILSAKPSAANANVVYPGPHRFNPERRTVLQNPDMFYVKPSFEDLLERLGTDYIDLGMIHFVDSGKEWNDTAFRLPEYILELKAKGTIRHIGIAHTIQRWRSKRLRPNILR